MKEKVKNREIGVFFRVNNKKFVTYMDYRGKNKFKQLLNDFTINAEIYEPQLNDRFKFIDLKLILQLAYDALNEKQKANKLITYLLAQNNIYELA